MSTAIQLLQTTTRQMRHWGWFKKLLLFCALVTFMTSSFMYLTPIGSKVRQFLAETVISTQHRDWAWIFVGGDMRDYMVRKLQMSYDLAAEEKQDINLIQHVERQPQRKDRTMDELIKVEDISGTFWKGKKMYVFDPTTIKIMTPSHAGEGERISSMVKRTGAVAGVNAGGFVDPDGLGNGFAPIGPIIASGEIIYTDQDGSIPQHTVGFTKEGTLVIGKYDIFQLRELGVTESAMFYPRVIANGKPLITSGDGGWGRGPRTAVGQKADGTVIFIVIDGRQTSSVGATLKEVQDLLLEEGCINAGFLDGGASSELVVGGELVTKPSSRYGERRLPSAFLVYDHPEDVVAPRVWDNVTKIDPGGAYDHPDFLKEQAELRAKQAKNPPATTTPAVKQEPAKEPAKTTESGSTTETGASKPGSTGGASSGAGAGSGASAGTGGGASPTTGSGSNNAAAGGKQTTPAQGQQATPDQTTKPTTPGANAGSPSTDATTGGSGTPSAPGNTTTTPGNQQGGAAGSTNGTPAGGASGAEVPGLGSISVPPPAAGGAAATPADNSAKTGTGATGQPAGTSAGPEASAPAATPVQPVPSTPGAGGSQTSAPATGQTSSANTAASGQAASQQPAAATPASAADTQTKQP